MGNLIVICNIQKMSLLIKRISVTRAKSSPNFLAKDEFETGLNTRPAVLISRLSGMGVTSVTMCTGLLSALR